MTTILTLAILMLIIYGGAIVWCVRTTKKTFGGHSAKVIKMNQEFREMLDYKLDMDYTKTKSL
jgi:hypothetical protein